MCLAGAFPASASQRLLQNFSGGESIVQVVASDSIILAIEELTMTGMLIDSCPAPDPVQPSYAPGVACFGNDRFSFFWSRGAWPKDTVKRREFQLGTQTTTPLPAVSLSDSGRSPVSYLHASSGQNSFLCTYVENLNSNGLLYGCNDTRGLRLFNVDNEGPYSSSCHISSDTYFVVHRMGNRRLIGRVITATTGAIAQIAVDTIGRCPTGSAAVFTNVSVASEPGGLVLVLFSRNAKNTPRNLEFKLLDPATFATIDSGLFATNISNPAGFGSYDDAPVVGYAPGKFAALHWDLAGVVLDTFTLVGSELQHGSVRLASGSGFQSTTLASNGTHLVAAWKGPLTSPPQTTVEGMLFDIQGHAIDLVPRDTFTFSRPEISVSSTTPDIAMAMDSLGSIAVTWAGDSNVRASIFAMREVCYQDGYWISSVETIPADNPDDTLRFVGFNHDGWPGSTHDSIRTGPSPAISGLWSDWADLHGNTDLSEVTTGTNRYFQIKTVLLRDPVYATRSPVIHSYAVRWNWKPRILGVDSIWVNGSTVSMLQPGDTLRLAARRDSVDWFFRAVDADTGDTVWAHCGIPGMPAVMVIDTAAFPVRHHSGPLSRGDTIHACTLWVQDQSHWRETGIHWYLDVKNSAPDFSLGRIYDRNFDGVVDTVPISGERSTAYLVENDSVVVLFSLTDTNDPALKGYLRLNGAVLDSITAGQSARRVVIRGSEITGGLDTLQFLAADPDTTVSRMVYLRINQPPRLDSVQVASRHAYDGDTIRIVPGRPLTVTCRVNDPNVAFWDTITCRFTTPVFDSVQLDSHFTFIPTVNDSHVLITVTDLSGTPDTLYLHCVFPWFSGRSHPGYEAAARILAQELSVIVGDGKLRMVPIPLVNTGTDTLVVDSLRFKVSSGGWMRLGVVAFPDTLWFDSLTAGYGDVPRSIPPGDSLIVVVRIDHSSLRGDGIVADTLFISTDDPVNPADTLVVAVEYNDLPRILSLSFQFDSGTPHYLTRRSASERYRFPPHARIAVDFSEPMDSSSAFGSINAYSVFDSAMSGSTLPIDIRQSWSDGYRKLLLSPHYLSPSMFFGNILPPPGMFIPTDSITLVISAALVDQATTPSGPNNLDVDLDFIRDNSGDTLISVRVDSCNFVLRSIHPQPQSRMITGNDSIVLRFSSPILPGTIDTSTTGNRSLLVTSRFLSRFEPERQAVFSRVYTRGDSAVFVPVKRFFYGDSVRCHYRGITARDSLGYPLDANRDGIAINIFDQESQADDTIWTFTISGGKGVRISPADHSMDNPFNSAIFIEFDNPVNYHLVDTAMSGNRTLILSSRIAGGVPFTFDSVRIDSTRARFYPRGSFFSRDSVYCRFNGLLMHDTTAYNIDLGTQAWLTSADTVRWSFSIMELKVVSVSPDSAGTGVAIHAPIILQFNAPVSIPLFDTTLNAQANRSIAVRSIFSAGNRLPLQAIQFTAGTAGDSSLIRVSCSEPFFANDSVWAEFYGLTSHFSYLPGADLLPDTLRGVNGGRRWSFTTEGIGFYTYPNPFKPGSDMRHRTMGGIMFKNLHALRKGLADVIVTIYDMHAHPIYDTQEAGVRIHFEEGVANLKPQWLWNTCNRLGQPVASGIYFYTIKDLGRSTLLKGKILIVR